MLQLLLVTTLLYRKKGQTIALQIRSPHPSRNRKSPVTGCCVGRMEIFMYYGLPLGNIHVSLHKYIHVLLELRVHKRCNSTVKVGCGMGQGPASEVTHLKLNQIPVCLCYGTKIVPLSLALVFSLHKVIQKSKYGLHIEHG